MKEREREQVENQMMETSRQAQTNHSEKTHTKQKKKIFCIVALIYFA
jgi:hypothetical protein